MSRLFKNIHNGRTNIVFGIALFLILGVGAGIPLTIDFLGGSLLNPEQYQAWKVVHGYGVFLAFINYFFGVSIDHIALTSRQMKIASWCFLLTGLFGGVVRMVLVLLGALGTYGLYASLGESVFITIGTVLFVLGQMRTRASNEPPVRASRADVPMVQHT